ncbi:MAG: T9SS type A sorting domain-containing protein [Flavobacteriales bacterium]|nr:T9SS type A sorting domain-containing protein [Flavobacteriales bacterium]
MQVLLAPGVLRGQQPIVFDTVRLNPVNSFLVGFDVFENEDGYVVFSSGGDGTGEIQDVRTSSFDAAGSFQFERVFQQPRLAYYGVHAPAARDHNGGFASGVARFGGGEALDSLFLYRFNGMGDTIETSFLVSDTTVAIRKCIQSENSDYLLVGLHERPKNAFLCRATANGDLVSFTPLTDVPPFFAMSIAEDANQDLFICGYGESAAQNNINNANLIKCGPVGSVIWRRTKPGISWYIDVIATPDGGVVAIGFYKGNFDVPSTAFAVKYDAEGNEEWSRDVAQTDLGSRPCFLTNGFLLPDGTLALCGTLRNTTTPGLWDNGMLHKLGADGTILWSRYYAHYTGLPAGYEHVFNAVQPTSDGGFILTGEAQGPTPPNTSRLWLVKLDSMGCLVPGCHTVGVEEFESELQDALQVGPNPASEAIQLTLDLPEGYRLEGAVEVHLLDEQGKEVKRHTIGPFDVQLRATLEIAGLASGLYYIHLRDERKWLAGTKVVVE